MRSVGVGCVEVGWDVPPSTVWMPESSQGHETKPSYCLHLLSLLGQVTKLQQMSGHTVPFPPLGHPPSMVPGELPMGLETASCALLVPCRALVRAWVSHVLSSHLQSYFLGVPSHTRKSLSLISWCPSAPKPSTPMTGTPCPHPIFPMAFPYWSFGFVFTATSPHLWRARGCWRPS